jgi:hypothetical protein
VNRIESKALPRDAPLLEVRSGPFAKPLRAALAREPLHPIANVSTLIEPRSDPEVMT